jgi:hypothetical protein
MVTIELEVQNQAGEVVQKGVWLVLIQARP